ncbi:diacylglycerol/lipid kinase family protein [Acuticoccus yangtzensis]|uniref:diacylglycerol/lipid kinase family protein n=1 Tax=Acuticoccus yangtzensis TaxID=1443441 RepID=UPI0009497961|nr:diacylglycerol kinase family protein [Acuticoccus yangtzensis]
MPSAALIFNASSGRHLTSQGARDATIATLERAGITVNPMPGDLGEQLVASREAPDDIIIVSGGDGTIRATIETHRGHGRPIGILPAGTMNLLALDFGIPEDPDEAAQVIASGHTRNVDYGCVENHVFLHTLFTGLPVRIGVHREARRGKMSALDRIWLAAHALTTLPRDPKLSLSALRDEGGMTELTSPSFALLVGTLGTQMLPRPRRETVDGGNMTIFAIHPKTGADVARMLLRGAFGQLASDDQIDKVVATRATIKGPRRRMHAMLDGEDTLIPSPAEVTIVQGEIQVFAPPVAEHPPETRVTEAS